LPVRNQQSAILSEHNTDSFLQILRQACYRSNLKSLIMKYAIHIAPVTENKSAVKRILREIIGPGQGNVINDLINSGGVLARDLSNEDAEEILTRLRETGVVVEKKE